MVAVIQLSIALGSTAGGVVFDRLWLAEHLRFKRHITPECRGADFYDVAPSEIRLYINRVVLFNYKTSLTSRRNNN